MLLEIYDVREPVSCSFKPEETKEFRKSRVRTNSFDNEYTLYILFRLIIIK